MTYKNKRIKGVTLIELVVAMGIFLIALTALTSIFLRIVKAQRRYFALQDVQENARHIVETMTKEIRMSRIQSCSSFSNQTNISIKAFSQQFPTGTDVSYIMKQTSQSTKTGTLQRNSESIISSKTKIYWDRGWFSQVYPRCTITSSFGLPRLTFVIPLAHSVFPGVQLTVQNTLSSRYLVNL